MDEILSAVLRFLTNTKTYRQVVIQSLMLLNLLMVVIASVFLLIIWQQQEHIIAIIVEVTRKCPEIDLTNTLE